MDFFNTKISNIPTIIWGEQSDKVYIYVHGKMSCKEYAKSFAKIAETKGYQTVSFNLPEHGERKNDNCKCNIWNGISDLTRIYEYACRNWKNISLFACSLGAFFSLNAYQNKPLEKCLFQSPILDMVYLINRMMVWFEVSETQLYAEKEISTPIDTLSWDYYQYVKQHPINVWDIPTCILYGGKDEFQSLSLIQNFSDKFNCKLTVSQRSEHSFMSDYDNTVLSRWLIDNI